MFVVGTAGHVDHGKSTLIASLTGINPDRLKEEQERQMTIDLGFAWFTLPSGEEIGIVDVPGHRDFIENMLSGVTGIDAVLFIVAADEGVMPQTREHLDILNLLAVQNGIIVLTKVDLAEDEDWIELVEGDIQNLVSGSALEGAPIIRYSAITREGETDLIKALTNVLGSTPPREDRGKPRLPIDRIFSLKGFGTVVTGTLRDGTFSTGDLIEVQPSGIQARVRSIQNHKKQVDRAHPGSRTAMNLTGVETDALKRGEVVCIPDTYKPTSLFDAQVNLLENIAGGLKHDDEIKLFIGSGQGLGRARVIGAKEITPGKDGYVQFMLNEPVLVAEDDNLIIRRPSPQATIGGGRVLVAHPKGKHKRFSEAVISKYKALAEGSEEEKILLALSEKGIIRKHDFLEQAHLDQAKTENPVDFLIKSEKIVVLKNETSSNENPWIVSAKNLGVLKEKINRAVDGYHKQYPLRKGMPVEECRRLASIPREQFSVLLDHLNITGDIEVNAAFINFPSFSIRYSDAQEKKIKELEKAFRSNPNQPPLENHCKEIVGDEVYVSLIQTGELVKISESIVYWREHLEKIRFTTIDQLKQKGKITVAEFRDLFSTSRKYAIALLEYFDGNGVTKREGDYRMLK